MMQTKRILSAALLAFCFASQPAVADGYQRDGRKITIQLPAQSEAHARTLRLTGVSDNIIDARQGHPQQTQESDCRQPRGKVCGRCQRERGQPDPHYRKTHCHR